MFREMRRHNDARAGSLKVLMEFLSPFIMRNNLSNMIKRQQEKASKEYGDARAAMLAAISKRLPPSERVSPTSIMTMVC